MQIAPQSLSDPANPDAGTRQKDFAHQLAKTHVIGISHPGKTSILQTLQSWQQALRNANAIFKGMPSKDLAIARAREWMLDNFYVVNQTFRQINKDLPANFLNQLPRLTGTSLRSYPRILALALEWIGYNKGQIDLPQTVAFIQAYQESAALTIGELWALPIMLRIGVLEWLACASAELAGIETPKHLSDIPSLFVSPKMANETIVADCFISLRLLSTSDWKTFFEQTSRVEQILRNDPAGIYASMDFDTRNSYRKVIEELARHSKFNEEQVAQAVIEFSGSKDNSTSVRKAHVGFYLRDRGRVTLENKLGYKPGIGTRIRSVLLAHPTSLYLGTITIISMLLLGGLLTYAAMSGGSLAHFIIAGVIGFGLALDTAIIIVNWNVTHLIKPQSLPRMDFSEGIAPGNRTMVVIPTLLERADELKHLLEELELYCISNPDPQLTYALLTDFGDAPALVMPQDEQLLALAKTGIENLNQKYAGATPFYLFHRQRQWNPSEGVWMGWERKRGKLADFNRLLLNLGETSYTSQVGDVSILPEVKYVITLDADTSLPQGSANRLIATMTHPLNRAEFSADGRSVVAGYTVLQPRVAIKPTSANRSLFSRIFTGRAGYDLYSFAVSDVYQDLFGEGSYVGKGIYDVAAFERSLAGQVRQNTLLSHDLFEGIYGRAALVTDIVLYEEYPSRYLVYARRLRRWIRGDWQLLPWLFPIVRTQKGMAANRLSVINRWKVFDNLRRSLMPATLLALLAAGWLYLSGSPFVWTMLAVLPSALPIVVQAVQDGRHNHGRLSIKQLIDPIRLPLTRWALAILFLPNETMLTLGAIGTTLTRLLIKRKNLLQWTTAANVARLSKLSSHYETWVEMAASLVLSVLLGISVAIFNPAALWVALPLLVAWLIAPQIAILISRSVTYSTAPILETQRRQILRLARRTWAFFEQFAGPDDHWLPPDHYQESPRVNVAHYTTPTNIGLYLVSTLSAHDLGYLGLSELAIRLRLTFENLDKLEHYRGHLLNWYDSQTLAALPPRYISTVDSGNFAACLITLKQGCLAMKDTPVLDNKQWQGLLAILDILSEALQALEKNNAAAREVDFESFEVDLNTIYKRISAIQDQPINWTTTLNWLSGEGWESVSQRLLILLESYPNLQPETLTELQLYLNLMHHHLQDMQRSLDSYAPWLKRLDSVYLETSAGRDFRNSLPAAMPSLAQAPAVYEHIQIELDHFKSQVQDEATDEWCKKLGDDFSLSSRDSHFHFG